MKHYHRINIIIILVFSLISCEKENDNYLLIYKGTDHEYEFGKEGIFFTYDRQNRLVKREDMIGDYGNCDYIIEEYSYNYKSLITMITETKGLCNYGDMITTESTFEYDSIGKIIQKNNKYIDHRGSTFWNYNQIISYTYDENKILIEIVSVKHYLDMQNPFSESLVDNLYYNAKNQITRLVSHYSGSGGDYIKRTEYIYDENGNVTNKMEYYNDNFFMEHNYKYDDTINPLYNISALNRQDNVLDHQSKNNMVYYNQKFDQTNYTITYIYSYNSNNYPKSVESSYNLVDIANPLNNDDGIAPTEIFKYEKY